MSISLSLPPPPPQPKLDASGKAKQRVVTPDCTSMIAIPRQPSPTWKLLTDIASPAGDHAIPVKKEPWSLVDPAITLGLLPSAFTTRTPSPAQSVLKSVIVPSGPA